MKILPILLLFVLSSCSSITVVSLSSNVVTYSITGKTNADIAVSMLMGKDCYISRIIKEKEVCE
jgi:hypothetical protein